MQTKIDCLLKKKDKLTQVESNFIVHVQNKQFFSPPEEKIIKNLYHKYCENGWMRSYDKKKRRIAKSCAKFWMNNPPSHSELAAKILNDPDFVPTREQYKEICECKEARNFLYPDEAEPLYPAGTLVKVSGGNHEFRGKLGVVVRVQRDERKYPSNPNIFLYHVLPQGVTKTLMFNEKDLKLMEINR